MKDQAQTEIAPLRRWHHRVEFKLNLHWIGLLGDSQQVRETGDVRVHRQSRLPKGDTTNDIGGLASDARETYEVLHGRRYLAVILVDQDPRHSHKALRLLAEQPDSADVGFDLAGVHLSERPRIWETGKQRRCRLVYSDISCLSRQNRRHQEFKWVPVVEFTLRIGIFKGQALICDTSAALR